MKIQQLKDEFESLCYDIRFDSFFETARTYTVLVWVMAVSEMIGRRKDVLVCRVRGHRFESVSLSAENGSEDVMCSRCGHSEHFQF